MPLTTRANFLKGILAGITAAPLAAKSNTYKEVEGSAKWKEKHWNSGQLKFSEYILPRTMHAIFQENHKDRPSHRQIVVPMFDRDVVKESFSKMVENAIEASVRTKNRVYSGMPVVDEKGNPITYDEHGTESDSHITIVKIDGYPTLMGIQVSSRQLIPIRDFYQDVAIRNRMVKKGMGKMEADYSQPVKEVTKKPTSIEIRSNLRTL